MLQVFIQAESGSCEKHRYRERTLEYLETQRVPLPYPYPYGFIVGTRAVDGDCVDCYVITATRLAPGTLVECEPIGLLLQFEDGGPDHKVLAALPGQETAVDSTLREELERFIRGIFAMVPEASVRVGPILPREAALEHLASSRTD